MEWKNAGAELPPKWKTAVSKHHRELLNKKGLGQYAWCVAAEVALSLPVKHLRALATKLRKEAEEDWSSFEGKWDNREETAKAVRSELLKALAQALRPIPRSRSQAPAVGHARRRKRKP